MNHWLCIISDYNCLRVALCRADSVLEVRSIDKKFGSQLLLPTIDKLLKEHSYTLYDMDFIGVNAGPAPYTSLRIVLATANGLHAASGIPLIAVDALKVFVQAHKPATVDDATVVLLNAFNQDLFYAIARYNEPIETGYDRNDALIERLQRELSGLKITWLGNAAPHPIIYDYPLTEQFVAYAWQRRLNNETTNSVLPLYLKQIKDIYSQ